jgi:hypothetical protein
VIAPTTSRPARPMTKSSARGTGPRDRKTPRARASVRRST